jgi:CheY-like chemotaxis protein
MPYSLGLHLPSSTAKPVVMDIDGLLKGLSILLIEDDPDSAELVSFIFEIAEAQVVRVASGGEALLKLETFKPDILVSNIALPDIDGYSLLEFVYAYEIARRREIIAVAVTASARDVDRARAMALGFHGYIPKPIEPVKLVVELAKLSGCLNNYESK